MASGCYMSESGANNLDQQNIQEQIGSKLVQNLCKVYRNICQAVVCIVMNFFHV